MISNCSPSFAVGIPGDDMGDEPAANHGAPRETPYSCNRLPLLVRTGKAPELYASFLSPLLATFAWFN